MALWHRGRHHRRTGGIVTAPVDDMPNNLVATGALFAILHSASIEHSALTSVTMPSGNVGNQIDITFSFLRSPYRVTIKRVDEPEAS